MSAPWTLCTADANTLPCQKHLDTSQQYSMSLTACPESPSVSHGLRLCLGYKQTTVSGVVQPRQPVLPRVVVLPGWPAVQPADLE